MTYSNLPFQMHLEHDNQGRIIRKVELVQGREPRDLRYVYDKAGRLTEVHDAAEEWGPVERYAYDHEGRRISAVCTNQKPVRQELVYTKVNGETRLKSHNDWLVLHDENGFRWGWCPNGCEEQWVYSPDYKLLQVLREDERGNLRESIEFDHDRNGQRDAKFVNGQKVEVYDWYDLIRLDAAATHDQDLSFWYNEGERVPHAATLNGEHELYLYYDQVGSLRVVADKYGRVVKEVRYSAFGVIEEDTNPDLFMPIGFAGGLHDRDVGFVRFGFRDYDPVTARFTATDPLGYAAGDSDLYGYCFDDPVNGIDPLGLEYEGFGVYAEGSALFRKGSVDIKHLEDEHGDKGIAITGSIGGTTDILGGSFGGAVEFGDADSIHDTSGKSETANVQAGAGAAYSYGKTEGEGYTATEHRVGPSAGLPIEAGITKDYRVVIPLPKIPKLF